MSVGCGVIERLDRVPVVFQKLPERLIHSSIRGIIRQCIVVYLEIRAVIHMGAVSGIGVALDLAPCVSSRADRLGLQCLQLISRRHLARRYPF